MLFLRVALIAAFVFSLFACGGGGGGGSINAASPITISGQMLVPGGSIALLEEPSISDGLISLVLPSAMADFMGVTSAPNGTIVELVRLDNIGSVSSVLATTTTNSSGQFTFDISGLSGVAPDITLAVQLPSGILGSGQQFRSFVTSNTVDITPESELIFQRVQTAITGASTLTDYSIAEVESLVFGLRRVTTASAMNTSGSIMGDVGAVDIILTNNTDLINFFNAAATAGEETSGPGDNNYIINGMVTFNGSVSVGGGVAQIYTNQITTTTAAAVQGVATQQLASNNFLGDGSLNLRLANTLTGIVDYTDVVSGDSTEPTPVLFYPYIENEQLLLFSSLDIDGEGFLVSFQAFTEGSLNVPAGTFSNVVRVSISATSNSTTDSITVDYYFAANRGLIRQDISSLISGVSLTASEEAASGIAP